MASRTTVPLLALGLLAAACARRGEEPGELALAGGSIESLDVHVDGDVVHALVATTLPGGQGWALYHVPLSPAGKALAPPARVDAGAAPPHRPSHGGDPQIAARGADLVAVWTTRGSGYKERGPLQTAISRDGGRSWRPGGVPAPVADRGGQAFIDAAVDGRGGFHIVWLDDRGEPKGLYHGTSADGGATWRVAAIVDGATCQCCWNRLVRGPGDELYVLYRDSQPRDMAVARRDGAGSWRALGRAGAFDWAFDGCPHVGGGLAVAADGDGVAIHATVWTGAPDGTGLFHVRHDGAGWQAPRLLAAEGRHSDVAAAPGGRDLVAVWDQRDPVDRVSAVFAAGSRDGGRTWSAARRVSGARRAGYPRVVHLQGRFRVLWIDEAEEIRTVRLLTL